MSDLDSHTHIQRISLDLRDVGKYSTDISLTFVKLHLTFRTEG